MLTEKEKLIDGFKKEIEKCKMQIEANEKCIDTYKKAIDKWHLEIVDLETRMNLLEDCIEAIID